MIICFSFYSIFIHYLESQINPEITKETVNSQLSHFCFKKILFLASNPKVKHKNHKNEIIYKMKKNFPNFGG